MKQNTLVDSIIQTMLLFINKHGLKLMETYPDDLLVHDKAFLEQMASPGAHIAWMVGDRHSHIVPLGFERENNELVHAFTNLANNDRFFSIKINTGDRVAFTELSRDEFKELAKTPVQYSMSCGDTSDFNLMRSGNMLGHIKVENTGSFQEPIMKCTVTPMEGISLLDRSALEFWAGHAITKTAGTLFVKSKIFWNEAIPQRKQA